MYIQGLQHQMYQFMIRGANVCDALQLGIYRISDPLHSFYPLWQSNAPLTSIVFRFMHLIQGVTSSEWQSEHPSLSQCLWRLMVQIHLNFHVMFLQYGQVCSYQCTCVNPMKQICLQANIVDLFYLLYGVYIYVHQCSFHEIQIGVWV